MKPNSNLSYVLYLTGVALLCATVTTQVRSVDIPKPIEIQPPLPRAIRSDEEGIAMDISKALIKGTLDDEERSTMLKLVGRVARIRSEVVEIVAWGDEWCTPAVKVTDKDGTMVYLVQLRGGQWRIFNIVVTNR